MKATAELPKTVAEATSLEDAFEAYSKTAGARHPMWNGNLTFSKFKQRFGKAWNARQTPSDAASNLLSALFEAFQQAGVNLGNVEGQPQQAPQEQQPEPQERSVQPDNLMQPPTNKMVWLLRMQALEAGISTSFKCPLFRGQASKLIGEVKAAGNDKAKIRRLLEA